MEGADSWEGRFDSRNGRDEIIAREEKDSPWGGDGEERLRRKSKKKCEIRALPHLGADQRASDESYFQEIY